ncbi:transcriptional regulator [Actinoplanes sp. NPDC051411]|uniref:transcriptional regulator n=1 Tax=Actinoplanes sp. NPDC051411 TaxID=3155522 RepID=UPI00341E828F
MVIGLVVHDDHRARFAAAAATLTGVDVAWATYREEIDIRDRVAELLRDDRPDGVLLGPVPWARSRDLIPPGLPVAITLPGALDLALAWARAEEKTPVSIDTFSRATVDEVAAALELDPAEIRCQPFDPGRPVDEVVQFHREQAAPYVISVRTGVAAALGSRVISAHPTPEAIRADLHELALRIRAHGQRFAAAVFVEPGLRRRLKAMPEFADAWIDGEKVFGPAALFERATQRWTTLPAGRAAGFGIGATARLTVDLAERAAARARAEAGPAGYLFTDDGLTIGPIGGSGPPLAWSHRAHGAHGGLAALAERAGLSAATLSRLAAVERGRDGRPLSPGELARTLGITDPSGRRLIRKLSAADLAVSDGSAQAYRKGRPTRLYRLAINRALKEAK